MTRFFKTHARWLLLLPPLFFAGCGGSGGSGNHVNSADHYEQTNLVATSDSYKPQIVEPGLVDAWGLSLRPGGAGGHWWVVANKTGTSYEYVGDVNGVALHQDSLKTVTVPASGGGLGTPTGTVFNVSGPGFVIDQQSSGGPLHSPAKFIFATDTGVVSAWTERANADGTTTHPPDSVIVYDQSTQGASYFGIAISPTFDRLYLADFGVNPGIVVLNDKFQNVSSGGFVNPYPGFAPFNVQTVGTSIFVTYAKQETPGAELHGIALGKIAEFDVSGKLIATWDDRSLLNAPWGVVKAPDTGFGLYSGKLLVANFGNGTITVFDPATRKAIDYLRGGDGKPMVNDGIWALDFGNGVSLGEANALYFTAGPNGETEGLFGKIKAAN